ncbi:Uncharacterized protein T4B_1174 [Trichinella pseudospiralis]|uniref:SAM domain-containing protein n=1 Tax=Trichinella pseudospiralis TaxID=6337 RepID=A0A0V1ICZ0_TRIPS|nr:Uncharacterized protein T4A_3558 [Trichinella pseudospiralis]KRZ20354.1 Uncharacterized protein T4B_1174 [Trichinella pseudospiralis]
MISLALSKLGGEQRSKLACHSTTTTTTTTTTTMASYKLKAFQKRSLHLTALEKSSPNTPNTRLDVEDDDQSAKLTRYKKKQNVSFQHHVQLEQTKKNHNNEKFAYPQQCQSTLLKRFGDNDLQDDEDSNCSVGTASSITTATSTTSNSVHSSSPLRGTLSQFIVTRSCSNHERFWRCRPLIKWTMADIIAWLRYLQMEHVISILIGYDLKGEDLLHWNENILIDFGIADEITRKRILFELKSLREKCKLTECCNSKPATNSSSPHPLYPLLTDIRYESMKAISVAAHVPLENLAVTELANGALAVTEENFYLDLKPGDIIVELNGISCIGMSEMKFQKHLARCQGNQQQLVVLKLAHCIHSRSG